MKKFIAFFLLVVYSGAYTGVAARIDYCGNTVRSVSLSFEESDDCACRMEAVVMDCCSSRQVLLKADTKDHQVQKAGVDFLLLGALLPLLYTLILANFPAAPGRVVQASRFYPVESRRQARLCVFLI